MQTIAGEILLRWERTPGLPSETVSIRVDALGDAHAQGTLRTPADA
jgi:hypothetical protein